MVKHFYGYFWFFVVLCLSFFVVFNVCGKMALVMFCVFFVSYFVTYVDFFVCFVNCCSLWKVSTVGFVVIVVIVFVVWSLKFVLC